jgi:hypothetical protein
MQPQTEAALKQVVQLSQDRANIYMRDVRFPLTGLECHINDKPYFSFKVMADDGQCWENVHPNLYNIYVFNDWAKQGAHPGGTLAIKKWADGTATTNSTFFLTYNQEASHDISK